MSELLKCPFCGGEAKVEQIPSATWDKFVVTCKSSKCIAFYIGYCDEGLYPTRSRAIEAWNTRKPMQNILERLEADKEQAHPVERQAIEEVIEIIREEGGL